MSNKSFDIIVYGATGFTGQLVCDYLALKNEKDVQWTIAGRSKEKLDQVHAHIEQKFGTTLPEPIIADASDQSSLNAMCALTKVCLSTVGPFTKYGEPLIAACIENKTSYCDITGETSWVRQMIDKYGEKAAESGSLMVSFCGFDSIPADLGVYFLVDHAQKQGEQLKEIDAIVGVQGSASGGTLASICTILESSTPRQMARMRSPFFLNDKPVRTAVPHDGDPLIPRRRHGHWTMPFLMAAVNTRVVRRSQEQLLTKYGSTLSYRESATQTGLFMVILTWLALGVGMLLLVISFTRNLLKKYVLPAPGTGPSAERRANSWFTYNFYATTTSGKQMSALCAGGCPGYGETCKMIAESALCLAKQRDLIEKQSPIGKGGFGTPASVMGNLLIERLQKAGIRFEILQ